MTIRSLCVRTAAMTTAIAARGPGGRTTRPARAYTETIGARSDPGADLIRALVSLLRGNLLSRLLPIADGAPRRCAMFTKKWNKFARRHREFSQVSCRGRPEHGNGRAGTALFTRCSLGHFILGGGAYGGH